MMNCKLCGQECRSFRSLSKHIRDQHEGYASQRYYDEFLRGADDGTCVVCGKDTAFISLSDGYKRTCSHKCGGILHRQTLAADEEKHKKFADKVAVNQAKIWEERKESGEDKKIHAKVGNTIKQLNKELTNEQLKEKYGWLNKLTQEEKQQWINEVMKKTGAHNWWKTAPLEEKQQVVRQRNATKLGITTEEYDSRYENLDEFEQYRWVVWILTERTYKEHKHTIDPENKRSPQYHLDHKFSVVRGFHLQVDPEIIASMHNLEILPASINSSKGGKCSLNIETLKEMYYG